METKRVRFNDLGIEMSVGLNYSPLFKGFVRVTRATIHDLERCTKPRNAILTLNASGDIPDLGSASGGTERGGNANLRTAWNVVEVECDDESPDGE